MKEFLIVCHVAVDFYNRKREKIFSVLDSMINTMVLAPVAIKEDPMFEALVSDGSLEVADTKGAKKRLENDPAVGIGAEGKKTAKKENEDVKIAKKETKTEE